MNDIIGYIGLFFLLFGMFFDSGTRDVNMAKKKWLISRYIIFGSWGMAIICLILRFIFKANNIG